MSHHDALKCLRSMCSTRGFRLRARWRVLPDKEREAAYRVRVATYEAEIFGSDGQSLHCEFWSEPSRSIELACQWLMDNHPRQPGAPRGNRNAAGKRTSVHRAEGAR